MRRGDIYGVESRSGVGSEAQKSRPAVVVSNDATNKQASLTGKGVVAVVPLTGSTANVYPFQILVHQGEIDGLTEDCKMQCEQIRSVDYGRIGAFMGSLPPDLMAQLDATLKWYLSLDS